MILVPIDSVSGSDKRKYSVCIALTFVQMFTLLYHLLAYNSHAKRIRAKDWSVADISFYISSAELPLLFLLIICQTLDCVAIQTTVFTSYRHRWHTL